MIPTNNYSIRVLFVLTTIVAFSLPGCTHRIADLTLVSTKNVDINNIKLNMKEGKRYRGSDCVPTILIFPLGIPNLKNAVDDALLQAGGNVMVDEVTYWKHTWFLIGAINCIEAEGTVLNIPDKDVKGKIPAVQPPSEPSEPSKP